MSEEMASEQSQFHSVHLHEDKCKGCTICVTGCPVEAIRVHDGKAHILEEVCIDCGECIRNCPNKAKYTSSSELDELKQYDVSAALVTPAIYGQFNLHYSVEQIHEALKSLGFDEVFDVAPDALKVSRATARILETYNEEGRKYPQLAKPFISSSCPTVIKLIQVRYPALLDNLLPLFPPVEVTARRARRAMAERAGKNKKVGIFLISPCSAKITVSRSPVGYDNTAMDGAFSFSSLYLPVLTELRKLREEEKADIAKKAGCAVDDVRTAPATVDVVYDGNAPVAPAFYTDAPDGLAWGRESGEAEYIARFLRHPEKFNWITCCGLTQIKETLEAIEDGQMKGYDFAEIAACSGGCLGGPLQIRPVSESAAILRNRLRNRKPQEIEAAKNRDDEIKKQKLSEGGQSAGDENVVLDLDIAPRPARQLSSDFGEARRMMEQLEEIADQLPGLDCGSCGAPNCRALAEDIVRGKAHLEDCVTIMKSRYEDLLFGKQRSKK